MRKLAIKAISCYQMALSPYLGSNCRFYPSCSEYATQAIAAHGTAKGGYLAARRLIKCHPFHEGGYDPVPGVAVEPDPSTNHQKE